MDTKKVFAYEWLACVGITSWGALKKGYAPWPPTIIYSTVALGLLSAISVVNEKLAVILSVGFLLALIVGNTQAAVGGTAGKFLGNFAAIPPPGYDVLQLGAAVAQPAAPQTAVQPGAQTAAPQGPDQIIDPRSGKPLNIMKG